MEFFCVPRPEGRCRCYGVHVKTVKEPFGHALAKEVLRISISKAAGHDHPKGPKDLITRYLGLG